MGFFEELDNPGFSETKLIKNQNKSSITITPKIKLKKQVNNKYNGIINLHCNCFLNCIIQLFYFLPTIREKILLFENRDDSSEFLKEFRNVFSLLENSNSSVDPSKLINTFGNEKRWFSHQQDANDCFKKSIIKCEEIGYDSISCEEFIDLKLIVNGKNNIYQSFDEFFEPIDLIAENRLDIDNFGLKDCKKFLKIENLPPILNLHLLRFSYDKKTNKQIKINNYYEFPEILDLTRLSREKKSDVYKLFAVIVHSGDVENGHYIIYINPKYDNNWFKFDDTKVSKCLKEEAIDLNYGIQENSSAYMLTYLKQDSYDFLND